MIGECLAGRYQLLSVLGQGGMGVVYRAEDQVLSREVAVKVVPPDSVWPELEERFQREAQLVARLDHPGIIPIHDYGRHQGALFFVMPVVRGKTLRQVLREGRLPLGDVLALGLQAARALDESHSHGIVHRDLKPENLMVTREEGGALRLRIMDFGLARTEADRRLTETGMLIGTVAYMSPEQLQGFLADERSDLWALGAILYECWNGEAPFVGTVSELLGRIVQDPVRPLLRAGEATPPLLADLVARCLQKDPRSRYATAGELATALEAVAVAGAPPEPGAHPTLRISRQVASGFVGRRSELAAAMAAIEAAGRAGGQLLFVGGPAGIGKSRFLDELAARADAGDVRILRGVYLERDRGFPYQGFCDVLRDHLRRAGSDAAGLAEIASELVSAFPILGELPALKAATRSAPLDRAGVLDVLARALERAIEHRPHLILLENLHLADVSVEALAYVFERLRDRPVVLAVSYRSDELARSHPLAAFVAAQRGSTRTTTIELGGLDRTEVGELVERHLAGVRVDGSVLDRLHRVSHGHPLFVIEWLRGLDQPGALDDTGYGRARLQAEALAEAIPASLQRAVASRIERLSEDQQALLTMAAILGVSFSVEELLAVAEEPETAAALWDRLVEAGWFEPEGGEGQWRFTNALAADALEAQLPRRRRRNLHRRVLEWLEARARPDAATVELALHAARGDLPEKAVAYSLRWAQVAYDSFSTADAGRAVDQAFEFLDDDDYPGDRSATVTAELLRARIRQRSGDADGALRSVEAAMRAAQRSGSAERLAEIQGIGAEIAWQARRVDDARRYVDGALAAGAAAEPELRLRWLRLAATLARLGGHHRRAEELTRLAVPLASSEERAGGRLVLAAFDRFRAEEPLAISTAEEIEALGNVFDTLFATDGDGRIVPVLVEEWEVREDILALRLRTGIRFSDGSPLSTVAVAAGLRRALAVTDPARPAAIAVLASGPDPIRVRSDNEMELYCGDAGGIFPALLADARLAVAKRDDAGRWIGTGSFRLEARSADRLLLARVPAAHREARLDQLEFRVFASPGAAEAAFLAGEVDVVHVAADSAPGRERAGARLVECARWVTYFVLLHRASAALADPRVRRAVTAAPHARELVWRTCGRWARPATGLIPPGLAGHEAGRDRPVVEASELRIDPPQRLVALLHPELLRRFGALVFELLAAWREVGVIVEAPELSFDDFLAHSHTGAGYDLFIGRWGADYPDPDNFGRALFDSEDGDFRAWFHSEAVDAMGREACRSARPAYREALARQIEDALVDDHRLLPLFHEVDARKVAAEVRDVELRGGPPFVDWSRAWRAEPTPLAAASGEIVVSVGNFLATADPARIEVREHAEVLAMVFEGLTRVRRAVAAEPWLAREVVRLDGGRRYRIRLREGVRFHDDRVLSARDVRWSFERLLRRGDSQTRRLLAPIRGAHELLDGRGEPLRGITIVSELELTIELDEPRPFFPELLADVPAGIVPEGTEIIGPSFAEGAIGTGPFRLAHLDPGRSAELVPHPGYWRPGRPRCERLRFLQMADSAAIAAAFRRGELAVAADLAPREVDELRRDPQFLAGLREAPRLSTYFLIFNVHAGRFAVEGERRSLYERLAAAGLARSALPRVVLPARGLIPPGLPGHEGGPAPRQTRRAESPIVERAPIALASSPALLAGGPYAPLLDALLGELTSAGYVPTLANADRQGLFAAIAAGEADLLLVRWAADVPDSDSFTGGLLHSREGWLGRYLADEVIDRLIADGRRLLDSSARFDVYRRIEERLRETAVLLPLFFEQNLRFFRPDVDAPAELNDFEPVVPYEELAVGRPRA